MSKLAELAEMLRTEKRSSTVKRISALESELIALQSSLDLIKEDASIDESQIERVVEEVEPRPIVVEQTSLPTPIEPVHTPEPKATSFVITQLQKDMQNLRKMIEKNQSMQYIGSGGGAGDVTQLDHPTRVVTGNYNIGRFDYYVGVNHTAATYITLPSSGVSDGRKLVIKDETGKANLIPIYIVGTVDNDINGAILRINNGALQLIYRGGWRVI